MRLPSSLALDAAIDRAVANHGVSRDDAATMAHELATKFDLNEADTVHALDAICVSRGGPRFEPSPL